MRKNTDKNGKKSQANSKIQVHVITSGQDTKGWAHTHGMSEYGLPELEIRNVPLFLGGPAVELLHAVCNHMLDSGKRLKIGDTLALSDRMVISFRKGMPIFGEEEHYRVARWELIDSAPYCNCDVCRAARALEKNENGAEMDKIEQNCCSICGTEIFECSEEVRPTGKHSGHEQVSVKVGDKEADVDKELAPLIEQLWKADIMTLLSCQEHRPGFAWIMFFSAMDLENFLNIVAEYDPDWSSLYSRINNMTDEGCWEYVMCPDDLALDQALTDDDCVEYSHGGEPCFIFNASVRFPRADLPILLDRMVRHNSRLDLAKEGADPQDDPDLPSQKDLKC